MSRLGTFVWDRLRDRKDNQQYVQVMEAPNTTILKMVIDSYPDEPDIQRNAYTINQEISYLQENDGARKVKYSQKDVSHFAGETYFGSVQIGRAYPEGSVMATLPSKIVNTAFKKTHVEIDIRSSTATMLCNAFRDRDAPTIQAYVENPVSLYSILKSEFGFDRSQSKVLINTIICSFPNCPADYGLRRNFTLDQVRDLEENRIIRGLKTDMRTFSDALIERYPDFADMIKRKVDTGCFDRSKTRHLGGVQLSYLAQDMEHSVMNVVLNELFQGNPTNKNIVWKYDGVIVPMTCTSGKTFEQVESQLHDKVRHELDISVVFQVSDLSANSYGICIPDSEIVETDKYKVWKGRFEKSFLRLKSPPVFMHFLTSSFYQDLSKEGFNHVTAGEPKEYIQKWMCDPDARTFTGRDYIPPPLSVRDGYLNTFKGLAGFHLPPNREIVDIERYLRHVDVLTGNVKGEHPDYASYLHRWIAQKVQKPGLKNGVMIFIRSAQGTGKDLFADLLVKIFGSDNMIKDSGIDKFAGLNSHRLEGKVICALSEMSYGSTVPHKEKLKALITDSTVQFEKKHVNSFQATNVVDFIGFSNDFGALPIEAGDRRYCIFTASSLFMQDADYFNPLIEDFNSCEFVRAVYDHYMSVDLTGFNSHRDRPITLAHQEMTNAKRPPIVNFLIKILPVYKEMVQQQDLYPHQDVVSVTSHRIRVSSNRFVEDWMGFSKECGFNKAESRPSMIQFLTREVSQYSSGSEKFCTPGITSLIERDKIKISRQQFRVYYLDLLGIENYHQKVFGEGDCDDDEMDQLVEEAKEEPTEKVNMAIAKVVHQLPTPRHPYLYVVKIRDETIYGSDDLEDINKYLGEAYVEQRGDKEFLIHQKRGNMEIELEEWYKGEHGKLKLEMKYPWYRKSRVT